MTERYWLEHELVGHPAHDWVCEAAAFYCKDPRYKSKTECRIEEVLEQLGFNPIFYARTLDGEASVNMHTEEGLEHVARSIRHTQGAMRRHGHNLKVIFLVDHEDCLGRGEDAIKFEDPKKEAEFCLDRLLETRERLWFRIGRGIRVILMYVDSKGAWIIDSE